tara:strand:- start:377 stop:670 length:294 start_codon:yes stop_codon:yes gene_type:complete
MLSDEAKIIRFKNQRNNMEKKLNEKDDELTKLKELYEGLEERHNILEKSYTKSCNERNKCELLIEKKMSVRMEEYQTYKDFYKKYYVYIDELIKINK